MVIQMACTHAAAMAVLATLAGAHGFARNEFEQGHRLIIRMMPKNHNKRISVLIIRDALIPPP
jgi:hypothetical protein